MPRTQQVVTIVPTGGGTAGSKIQIPVQPDLDGCLIVGFEAFTANQLASTPDRIAVIPAADAPQVSLTLNESSDKRFYRMPYTSLVAALNFGIFRQCEPFQVDWQKSQFEVGGLAITADRALVLVVQYLRPEDAPELFDELRKSGRI